jgi:uncharacterized protein YciI
MALHAVLYRYSTDTQALDEHRPEHKAYLGWLFEAGHIAISGPLGAGGAPTALLIMKADNVEDIEALLDKDPFFERDLITEREIRPWNLSYGSLD